MEAQRRFVIGLAELAVDGQFRLAQPEKAPPEPTPAPPVDAVVSLADHEVGRPANLADVCDERVDGAAQITDRTVGNEDFLDQTGDHRTAADGQRGPPQTGGRDAQEDRHEVGHEPQHAHGHPPRPVALGVGGRARRGDEGDVAGDAGAEQQTAHGNTAEGAEHAESEGGHPGAPRLVVDGHRADHRDDDTRRGGQHRLTEQPGEHGDRADRAADGERSPRGHPQALVRRVGGDDARDTALHRPSHPSHHRELPAPPSDETSCFARHRSGNQKSMSHSGRDLLEVAAQSLADDPAASMADIAAAAGVGRATAWRHLGSREQLLGDLYRRSLAETRAALARTLGPRTRESPRISPPPWSKLSARSAIGIAHCASYGRSTTGPGRRSPPYCDRCVTASPAASSPDGYAQTSHRNWPSACSPARSPRRWTRGPTCPTPRALCATPAACWPMGCGRDRPSASAPAPRVSAHRSASCSSDRRFHRLPRAAAVAGIVVGARHPVPAQPVVGVGLQFAAHRREQCVGGVALDPARRPARQVADIELHPVLAGEPRQPLMGQAGAAAC